MFKDTNHSIPSHLYKRLMKLDLAASEMLSIAKLNGHVYIVTNAVEGWVEETAKRYLPNVYQLLKNDI